MSSRYAPSLAAARTKVAKRLPLRAQPASGTAHNPQKKKEGKGRSRRAPEETGDEKRPCHGVRRPTKRRKKAMHRRPSARPQAPGFSPPAPETARRHTLRRTTLRRCASNGARGPATARSLRASAARAAAFTDAAPELSAPARLRAAMSAPGLRLMPCCFDALSARLIQRHGFALTFMSGFAAAAVRGYPDTGLLSFEEVRAQLGCITETTSIPVICDADTGYGNAMNVKRTVRALARAGAGGVMIEDQLAPKRCGHTRGKQVVGFDEAVSRLRAAVQARDESGTDVVIVARSDAAELLGVDEAIRRLRAFREVGADVTFMEAPRCRDAMQRYCEEVEGWKLANMLEQGDSPILPPAELERLGYKLAAYPLTLLSAAVRAMDAALHTLKRGEPAQVQAHLTDFASLRELVGFDAYDEEQRRYRS